jgi:adenosylcobinamide-phosphate synthase
MIGAVDLFFAFSLDLAIGDPRWLPHPVRGIGRAISSMERVLRDNLKGPSGERLGGIILTASIVVPVFILAFFITFMARILPGTIGSVFGTIILVYLISTTIAVRELIASCRLVIQTLDSGNIAEARQHLSMIVGRDTDDLSEEGILRATIETLAENLSDGVVAPVFYFVIGGLPLAMAYKAVNTLDSMVGYKNERYIVFGRASAKLDDIANYIPARITGLFIVIASLLVCRSFSSPRHSMLTMLRDGRNHTSPNSGVPEAAMAGALGVRLGGPSSYGGIIVEKPFIGDNLDTDYQGASRLAVTIASAVSFLAIFTAIVILGAGVLL